MGMQAQGASFEISINGKPISNRDDRAIAIDAGKYLKERHPNSEVIVRDIRDNSATMIDWEKGLAFVKA